LIEGGRIGGLLQTDEKASGLFISLRCRVIMRGVMRSMFNPVASRSGEGQLRTRHDFADKTPRNLLTLRDVGRGGGDRTCTPSSLKLAFSFRCNRGHETQSGTNGDSRGFGHTASICYNVRELKLRLRHEPSFFVVLLAGQTRPCFTFVVDRGRMRVHEQARKRERKEACLAPKISGRKMAL
jgi:hypothetical protein